MGVLQDFERRLEGAVEGFFARTFRSGLQPVELAKGLQRYARDTRHVAHDGIVVPNVYRFRISPADDGRLRGAGVDLETELARVVVDTAVEEDWILRGSALVVLDPDPEVRVGRYELAARIESTDVLEGERGSDALVTRTPATDEDADHADAPEDGPPPAPTRIRREGGAGAEGTRVFEAAPTKVGSAALRVVSGGEPRVLRLSGRTVAGRSPDTALVLADPSVSREHAAFVRRDGAWWVVDLGSTNGTAVNDRVAAEHALHDGDRVRLGEAVLEFVEG
jgi:hypothetical protein